METALGVKDYHRIPLSKILHTVNRKGFLQTVVWEKNAHNDEYKAECDFAGRPYTGVDRLHFIAANIHSVEDLKQYPKAYGGYCDLRPGTRTILMAYVTQDAVVRVDRETYAYVCCSMAHKATFTGADGTLLAETQVATFPCCEKDRCTVMCSEAAILSLIEYWNYRKPGMFRTRTSVDLNRLAGVPDAEVREAREGRGLYLTEVMTFFGEEGVNVLPLVYGPDERRRCNQDIYGFVESGFPVMVVLDVGSAAHAIVCLGHTYDRNSWSAMADIGYLGDFGPGRGKYHPNTTWIRNFIVHDDNFGPYYFLPTDRIEAMIIAGFVVLPDRSVQMRPTEAADAVFKLLSSEEFVRVAGAGITSPRFAEPNRTWLGEFLSHLRVDCGDGLVLRPVLIPPAQIVARYTQHEFCDVVRQLVGDRGEDHYWYVELTWPDIYCHRQMCCGSVVIDPRTRMPIFIHIPGLCVAWEADVAHEFLAAREDAPWLHFREPRPS